LIHLDANILIYAYDSSSPHHTVAKRWLEDALSGDESIALAWLTVLAFLRITTNPRILEQPFSIMEARSVVDELLDHPLISLLHPGPRHWTILRELIVESQARGPLVSDAHLAALTIEHGASLATTDRDFGRFPGLSFINPLSRG
jgi:toxin-antitoxin system PIN domain toxin